MNDFASVKGRKERKTHVKVYRVSLSTIFYGK